MNARVATATRLGFREQARRPLLLVLLVVLPFFFITRAIARTQPTPRLIGLPGGGEVLTTMKDVHGASMVTITVAFLAALCGAFIMRSARSADRRLVVAGFRPIEAVLPRLAVLASATFVVLGVSLAVTALSFTPASWPVFMAGNLLVGLTYACIGALAGSALGQLGATYLVLFLAMLGIGILQNPMFGDGTPGGLRREGHHRRSVLRRFPRLERARARARVARRPSAGCHLGAQSPPAERGVMRPSPLASAAAREPRDRGHQQ